jgi:hypothetical protein
MAKRLISSPRYSTSYSAVIEESAKFYAERAEGRVDAGFALCSVETPPAAKIFLIKRDLKFSMAAWAAATAAWVLSIYGRVFCNRVERSGAKIAL